MIKVNKFVYPDKFTPDVLTQEEFDSRAKSYCNELMRSKKDFFEWLWYAHHETEDEFYFCLIRGRRSRQKAFKWRREWRNGCFEWAKTALLAREYDIKEVD